MAGTVGKGKVGACAQALLPITTAWLMRNSSNDGSMEMNSPARINHMSSFNSLRGKIDER